MKKILVVDDENSVQVILKQILEKAGYAVDTAGDGKVALEKLKADTFNLLIADINMPVMDGVELLKNSKKILPELPVIFITAFGKNEIIVQAMKDGLADFIEKPFRMDQVLKTVKDHL
jgi:two-component system, NtrC family, response regulator HydG